MITSLNVNNFLGKENWNNLQCDFYKKNYIWHNEQKDYYFNYIKEHLISDDDVIILHEVPYIKEVEYEYKGVKKYKRAEIIDCKVKRNQKSLVYNELIEFCTDNNFEVLISKSNETSFFISIAICKKNKYEVLDQEFNAYKRRIIIIAKKATPKEIIIGVHVKNDSTYWEQLINLFTTVKASYTDKKIIIIGDMNVFKPGTNQKEYFNQLMSKGSFDAWIEMGNSNFDATFVAGTRIDYALISDNGFKCYNMFKDDSVRILEHSDHSAIILTSVI